MIHPSLVRAISLFAILLLNFTPTTFAAAVDMSKWPSDLVDPPMVYISTTGENVELGIKGLPGTFSQLGFAARKSVAGINFRLASLEPEPEAGDYGDVFKAGKGGRFTAKVGRDTVTCWLETGEVAYNPDKFMVKFEIRNGGDDGSYLSPCGYNGWVRVVCGHKDLKKGFGPLSNCPV